MIISTLIYFVYRMLPFLFYTIWVFFHAFSFYYFFPGIYNEIFFIETKHVEEPVYLFSVKPKVLFIVIEGISNNSHKKETC
jgi:hypothetical protein